MDEQPAHVQRDIAERLLLSGLREHERGDALRERLDFARAITDNLGEGVYALDTEGRVAFVNRAAAAMLGCTPEELLGVSQRTATAFRRASAPDTPVTLSVREGASAFVPGEMDLVCVRKDGSTFPVAYAVAPMVTEGRYVGMVVTFRDVTAVRALEQAREESVSLIAHDLRTPLTPVLSYLSILREMAERAGRDEEAGYAGKALGAARRLNALIGTLLDAERLDRSIFALSLEACDLVALVRETVGVLGTAASPIAVDAPDELVVVVDAARVRQALENLVGNARRYAPPGTPIAVTVATDADAGQSWAMLSVHDRGPGISAERQATLFERRRYPDPGSPGLGLGLYLVRGIAEAHGGRVAVESAPGIGTTFRLWLPQGDDPSSML